jgi:hypothetical protein
MIYYLVNYSVKDVPLEDAKKIVREDLKSLAPYEVDPPDEYKTGKKRRRICPKRGYEKSFRYVSSKYEMDGIKLVHGVYKPSFMEEHVGHAWVKLPNEIIFDGVLQRFYQREPYYNYYQCVKYNEYNGKEMYKLGYEDGGTFGPWENRVLGIDESNKITITASPIKLVK